MYAAFITEPLSLAHPFQRPAIAGFFISRGPMAKKKAGIYQQLSDAPTSLFTSWEMGYIAACGETAKDRKEMLESFKTRMNKRKKQVKAQKKEAAKKAASWVPPVSDSPSAFSLYAAQRRSV